jgi:hypothetical protein
VQLQVLEDADSDAERTQNVSKRRTQVEKRLDLAFLRMSQSQPDRETTEAERKLFIKQQLNAAKVRDCRRVVLQSSI